MKRKNITNLSSVAIIFRALNPSEIFIEVKDNGYPIEVFRHCLCPIGGNWIGEASKNDKNPLDTVRRELNEELTLERMVSSTHELNLLGFKPEFNFYKTSRKDYTPSDNERKIFVELKQAIARECAPFGDYLYRMPKELLEKEEDSLCLSSYWTVALNEEWWKHLIFFQEALGNLSNESVTVITSLQEIVKNEVKIAFGHDVALKKFFLAFGLTEAYHLSLIEGIEYEEVGTTLPSYAEYMKIYDIKKKPI